jgi:hypothetical protein
MILLLAATACVGDQAQASNPRPADEAAPAVAEVETPKQAPPAEPVETAELRTSPVQLTVYGSASKAGHVRGTIEKNQPFRVLERTAGSGCAGEGWGKVEGGGFACLDRTVGTTERPASLPKLIAFDSPEPSEWADYVKTGTYERDTVLEDQAFTPAIYGKPWRHWNFKI